MCVVREEIVLAVQMGSSELRSPVIAQHHVGMLPQI